MRRAPPRRQAAYLAWLDGRLVPAARVIEAKVESRRSIHVLRRPAGGGARVSRRVPGPDVTFRGVLEVVDPSAFADLLARGVGRHCAFGFGCLLLAPPGAL